MAIVKITRELPGANAKDMDLPVVAFVADEDVRLWGARGWKKVAGSAPEGLNKVSKYYPPQKQRTEDGYIKVAHIPFYESSGWTIDKSKIFEGDVVRVMRTVPGRPEARFDAFVADDELPKWTNRNYAVIPRK